MDKQDISKEAFEEIERYLLGQMDGETRLSFEKRVAADAELAAEVALQRQLFAVVQIGGFFDDRQKPAPVKTLRSYTSWYWAAAAVLVFALAAFWFVKQSASSTESLYAEYYQPDPGLPVEMGAADSTAYIFYDGMISYKENNYDEALTKWQKLNQRSVQNDTLQYYVGMAQLNRGDTDESITVLKKLANKAGAAYYQEANWYLALAYLKKGDKKNVQTVLKKIRSYPGALSLLNKL